VKTPPTTRAHFLRILVLIALLPTGSASAENCSATTVAQVRGLDDYQVTSCCYKGCGGACCRCGSASGYRTGCVGSCAVGHNPELKTGVQALSLPRSVVVTGRLVHAVKKTPLPNERLALTQPGGGVISGKSSADGTFTLSIVGSSSGNPIGVDLGDVPSIPASELGVGESPVYQLFMVKRSPGAS
jgi:hypothetical protein